MDKSIREISRETGIHENTLRKYSRDFSEFLPYITSGNKKKYRPEVIERFLRIKLLYEQRNTTEEVREILSKDLPFTVAEMVEMPDLTLTSFVQVLESLSDTLAEVAEQKKTLTSQYMLIEQQQEEIKQLQTKLIEIEQKLNINQPEKISWFKKILKRRDNFE